MWTVIKKTNILIHLYHVVILETPEDEKTNKVPENSSNHTSVVTVSNEICFVKSCASISKHSDYESKSDGKYARLLNITYSNDFV